jgi:Zn-dependent oligopeptidase
MNKIDKIVSEYIFNINFEYDPLDVTKKIISQCKSLENDINSDRLLELLCTIDTFYKSIGIMKIITKNKKYIECDILIEEYINDLFTNKKIYKKIKEIKKANPTNLLNMIYKNFFKGKNEKVSVILNDITKLKHIISKKIEENVEIKIQSSNTALTKDMFYKLQKEIKNANVRKEIEKKYYQKSDKVMDDLAKLLVKRHEYSNELGNESYFDCVKQKGSVQSIKELINDLILKMEDRSRKELERIHRELEKDGYSKKVDQCDIIYYYEKFKPTNLFKPVDILKVLLDISNSLFGITFSYTKFSLKLWSDKILTCKVTSNSGEEFGHVHFDMYSSSEKTIKTPLCIKLSNSPTRVCLTTSYLDINKKCMNYSDVITLFREFGTVIQMITHNKNELIVKNDEFDILMSQIMEYIAWERPVIEKICKDLDKTIVDHIMFMRYINFSHSIKIRCVNSLFDHILHNSSELIDLIKSNDNPGSILKLLYKKIYTDVMFSQRDIINLDIDEINPSVIYQEINGNEGKLYSNILTEILSFSVYTMIKDNKGSLFVKNVLSKESIDLRQNLHSFISKLNADSYDLYLREVIGYNEIDTELNTKVKTNNKVRRQSNVILTDTSANHFCDGCDSDKDSDDIIRMERKIF